MLLAVWCSTSKNLLTCICFDIIHIQAKCQYVRMLYILRVIRASHYRNLGDLNHAIIINLIFINYSVCQRVRTSSNTCSTTIPAKSRKISFRSEMDCTICRISLSRSSTITVFCSTSISWSSVNPWNTQKERIRWYYSTTINPIHVASADTAQTTVHFMFKLRRKGKQVQ